MAARRGAARARSSWPRASAFRKARCARPSTRWPPTIWSFGVRARARSSRRTPRKRRRCSGFCASGAATAAMNTRQAGCSTCAAARRRREVARLLELKASEAVFVVRRVLEYARRAGRARRHHAACDAVQGADAGPARSLSRLDVRILRNPVRRAHVAGAGKTEGDRRRQRHRGNPEGSHRRTAARRRAVDPSPMASGRSSGGAASAARAVTTI